jgi:cytochrome P450
MRKCVGDQFAMTEAVVALAMLMRRFKFRLAGTPEQVGMATGATIHTANGLKCVIERRGVAAPAAAAAQPVSALSA